MACLNGQPHRVLRLGTLICLRHYSGSGVDEALIDLTLVYLVGAFEYTSVNGSNKKVDLYTVSKQEAADFLLWLKYHGPKPDWLQ